MGKKLIFSLLIILSLLILASCKPSIVGRVSQEELLPDCLERAPYLAYNSILDIEINKPFEIIMWADQCDCYPNELTLNLNEDYSFSSEITQSSSIIISGTYDSTGKYSISGTISDSYGETPFHIDMYVYDDKVSVEQLKSSSLPSYTYFPRSESDDGIRNRKVLLMQGSNEERFWIDTKQGYGVLKNTLNISDEDIILLSPSNTIPESLEDFDSNWIDGLVTFDSIISAFNSLASELDGDDLLLVIFDGHGSGYYGSRTRRPFYNGMYPNNIYQGPISTEELNSYDDPDFQENAFQTEFVPSGRVNCVKYDGDDVSKGLDKFVPCFDYYPFSLSVGDYYYRFKLVSHFENLSLLNGSIISDNDVYIEKLINYAECDSNRNTIIEEVEIDNCDWSGLGMDAIEWSSDYNIVENYHPYSLINRNYYCFFDFDFDNTMDMMIFNSDSDPNYINCLAGNLSVDELVVFASDTDNDGYSNYYDITGDGDLDDWLSFDEKLSVSGGSIYDDDLSNLMNLINENTTKIFFTMSCFGGGMLRDISSKNIISMSASEEEDTSSGNSFIRNFYTALGSCGDDVDLNDDDLCSMSEIFLDIYGSRVSFDFPLFDDNADLNESYGDELIFLSSLNNVYTENIIPDGVYADTIFLDEEFYGNITTLSCYDFDGPLNFDANLGTTVLGELFNDQQTNLFSIDYSCNGISLISFSNVSLEYCPTNLTNFYCFDNADSCENINGQIIQGLFCNNINAVCCLNLGNLTDINETSCSYCSD